MVPAEAATVTTAVPLAEAPEAGEFTGGKLVGQREQFDGPVEDRRPREEQPPRGLHTVQHTLGGWCDNVAKDRLGALRPWVFEVVRFVADDDVPVTCVDGVAVLAHDLVVHNDHLWVSGPRGWLAA